MSSFISQNLTEIKTVTGCNFASICHIVFLLFKNQLAAILSPSAFEIPSIRLADRNLSSNRGPGYSSENGIAPTNAWLFSSVYWMEICFFFSVIASKFLKFSLFDIFRIHISRKGRKNMFANSILKLSTNALVFT